LTGAVPAAVETLSALAVTGGRTRSLWAVVSAYDPKRTSVLSSPIDPIIYSARLIADHKLRSLGAVISLGEWELAK